MSDPVLLFRFIALHKLGGILIRWDTNSLFEHVELGILPNPYDPTTVSGWIGAHDPKGVKIRPAAYCDPFRDYRYAVPVSQQAYTAALDFAHSRIGVPYDVKDIIGLSIRDRLLFNRKREICSEFTMQVSRAAGIQQLNVDPEFDYLVTPDMFHLEPFLVGRRIMAKGEPK